MLSKGRTTRICNAPKVELHVHLDGALDLKLLYDAALKNMSNLPEFVTTPWDGTLLPVRAPIAACTDLQSFTNIMTVGSEAVGLNPVLDCFYRFLPIVRGRLDLIEELTYAFCEKQHAQNVIYTELRYSPHEFSENPDSSAAEDVIKAVSAGIQRGKESFPDTVVKQILCCISLCPGWSVQIVDLAKRAVGVVGVDIAAGESHFETDGKLYAAHSACTSAAQQAGLGITVHAGESGPPSNVYTAIRGYGATRIGHGYRCIASPEYYAYAQSNKVHFEICPTSSVATMGVDLGGDWTTHPLRRMCDDRCSCSISTDDPTVFRTTLNDELIKCAQEIGVKDEEIEWMTIKAIEAAFHLTDIERLVMAKRVSDYWRSPP